MAVTVAKDTLTPGAAVGSAYVRDATVRAVTARVHNVCAPPNSPGSKIVDSCTPVRGDTEANSCVQRGGVVHTAPLAQGCNRVDNTHPDTLALTFYLRPVTKVHLQALLVSGCS